MMWDYESDDRAYVALRHAVVGAVEADEQEHFSMSLVGEDIEVATGVWNRGIDSHLEALTERSSAEFVDVSFVRRLNLLIHKEELPVFLRRLSTLGDLELAEQLFDSILYVLDIEENDILDYLPCLREIEYQGDTEDWWCVNDHTGCVWNDGTNTCMAPGKSDSPLDQDEEE